MHASQKHVIQSNTNSSEKKANILWNLEASWDVYHKVIYTKILNFKYYYIVFQENMFKI